MTKLWQELEKKQPFDLLEEEVFVNIQRTASVLSNEMGRILRERNLSGATYNILRILRGAGNAGRSCREIGRHLVTVVPDLTRLIDGLERRGWVTRGRTEKDRRMVMVKIAPAGLKVLAAVDPLLRRRNIEMLRHVGRGDLRKLSELLELARASPESEPRR